MSLILSRLGIGNMAADARISIMNAIGQTVSEKTVPYPGGQLAEDMDVSSFPNGIYMLLIRSEGLRQRKGLSWPGKPLA